MHHRFAAALAASTLCPALAAAQGSGPVPPARVQDASTAAPVGSPDDAVVNLEGPGDPGLQPPLQPREEGLRQGGFSAGEVIPPAGGASPAGGALLGLPPAMDRSSWRIPAGGPAPVEELELWDRERYARAVADDFEADPPSEPSVIASLESALSTWDE